MSGPVVQQLPLQPSERASFHEDPAIVNALEQASVDSASREFVVVNLENNDSNGEGSDWKSVNPKYGSLGDDVELGPKTEGKHVSNASKDDAAEGETVCRVCHLGLTSGNSESIVLGCACKQDLALCHRDCAEEWFKIRGNTVCEICGETAKNVHILEPVETIATRLEVAGGAEANTQVRATTMTRLRMDATRGVTVKNVLCMGSVVRHNPCRAVFPVTPSQHSILVVLVGKPTHQKLTARNHDCGLHGPLVLPHRLFLGKNKSRFFL